LEGSGPVSHIGAICRAAADRPSADAPNDPNHGDEP